MKRVAILLSVLMMVPPCFAQARTTITSGQEANKRGMGEAAQGTAGSEYPKQVSLKLEDGNRITLRNRFGPIVVTGTGGDTLEANVSMIKQGTASYRFKISTTRQGKDKIMISTAVTTADQPVRRETRGTGVGQSSSSATGAAKQPAPQAPKPTPPAQTVPPAKPQRTQPPQPRAPQAGSGARGGAVSTTRPAAPAPRAERSETTPSQETLRGVGDIRLEVRLPRNAHVDLIDSRRYAIITSGNPSYLTNTRNDVTVMNIETPVNIISSGDVQVTKVGGLEARTRAGNVHVKEVAGSVNISTVTGAVVVREAKGDVRAVSISGTISIECAKGRTEAGTANGSIVLTGIGGDLDANTTGGTISFTGAIREAGRYRLKSMSGSVRMFIQREPPGFLASLSSYKGQILLDFDLKTELSSSAATNDLPSTQGQPVRRVTGRYGEGDARITLDSFSGAVQLARAPSEVWKNCR